MTILQSVSGFILCSAAIVYAGIKLSYYGNRIAELTGLGKAWIGLILMAAVTSLPELITGISSVALVKMPNLAAGDVFGSCVFNLLILSVLDAFKKKPITSLVRNTHVFAAACAIILISISGAGILLRDQIPSVGWISPITPLIFSVYTFSIWLIYKFENKSLMPAEEKHETEGTIKSLRKTLTLYFFNAAIVVGAALFLPYFGKFIIANSGLNSTFFGTLFLAAATSLPELVVSISALRMGSLDMAVGNLFGSNIFNIFILGIDDLFYHHGSIYANIEFSHLMSILTIITMTSVAMIGLLFRAERKLFVLAADTLIIFILYIVLMIVLYTSGL